MSYPGWREAVTVLKRRTGPRTTIEPPSTARRWPRDRAQLDPTSPTGHFYFAGDRPLLLGFDICHRPIGPCRIGADRRHVSTLARVGGRISVIYVLEGFEVSGPVGPLMLKGVTAQGIGVGHRRALTRTLITWRSSRQSTAS